MQSAQKATSWLSQVRGLRSHQACLSRPVTLGRCSVQFSLSVQFFATPRTAAHQASLSIIGSWSLLKLMSIESVMSYNHFILCLPLLLGIFLTQGSNSGLLHCKQILYYLSYHRKSIISFSQFSSVTQSCPTLWIRACQTPLSMGFPRKEYWSGFLFPSPGDLPDPGIEPRSPALQAVALPSEPPGKPT